jgi:hypothetical protein
MHARAFVHEGVAAQCGADALHLVGCDAYADARAADENAALLLPTCHALAHHLSNIGVIHALSAMRPEVLRLVPHFRQERDDLRFHFKTGSGRCRQLFSYLPQ